MPKLISQMELILNKLPEEEREEFLDLVDSKVSLVDIRNSLQDLTKDYDIDISVPSTISIHKWREKRFTIAKQIENFNILNSEYEGVKVKEIVEKLVFKLSNLCSDILDQITSKPDEIALNQSFKQLPSIIRETRQLCQMVQDFRLQQSERELVISGASELFLMLKAAIADTPFEAGFTEMAVAAMEEMKKRYR